MNYICSECEEKTCITHNPSLGCLEEKFRFQWRRAKKNVIFVEKGITPNCAICKWIKSDLEFINQNCPSSYDCMAQGGKDAHDIYDSNECRKLFEEKGIK